MTKQALSGFLAGLFCCLGLAATAHAKPVELIYGKTGNCSRYGCDSAMMLVRVDNIRYEKSVFVLREVRGQTEWARDECSFERLIGDGSSEIWRCQAYPWPQDRFVIGYDVAGQIYWDNNDGEDFRFDGELAMGGSVHVKLAERLYSSYSLTTLSGSIYVRDLGDEKSVEVVYSRDGWETIETIPASFSYGVGAFEVWRFSLEWKEAAEIDLAVRYIVKGEVFWDNNFGADFAIGRQR